MKNALDILHNNLFDESQVKRMLHEVGTLTKADRCYIIKPDLPRMKGKAVAPDEEYLSSPDIKSVVGYDFPTEDVEKFVELYLNIQDLIVFDYEKIHKDDDKKLSGIKRYGEIFGVKTGIGVPFYYMREIAALLVIEYVKERVLPSEEELNVLRKIGAQVGIAHNQAQLYKKEKQAIEKETLLKDMTDTIIRASLDINKLKKAIVTQVGKYLDAERVVIHQINPTTNKYMIIDEASEYRSFDDIVSYVGIDIETPELSFFRDLYFSRKEMICPDFPAYVATLDEVDEKTKNWLLSLNLKSDYAFPIIYQDKLLASLYITYDKKYVTYSKEELDNIRRLITHISIALHQAELYNVQKRAIEREIFLRTITEQIRSSFDVDFIKQEMILQLGHFLKADRVAFADYDTIKGDYIITEGNEYRSSQKIKTFIGYDFHKIPGFVENIREVHLAGKDIVFSDLDKYLEEKNLKGTGIENFYRDFDCMSCMAINIYHGNSFYADLVITFEEKRDLTEDDINFIKTIAGQASIAIQQSRLYEKEKQTVKKEQFLRKIADSIRNTNDIDETLFFICKELTEFLQIQGTKINLIDIDNKKINNLKSYSAESEFLKNNFNKKVENYILEKAKDKTQKLIISGVENADLDIEFKKYLQSKKVQSVIMDFTQRIDETQYVLIVSDDKIRTWSQDEIDVVEKVSEYINKVIMGATLYSKSLFISNVLHELKNPLTAINTFSEAIINRDSKKSEITSKFIGKIKNNAERLNNIIDNMLFVASIGDTSQVFRDIKLFSALKNSIDYVKDFAASKNIKILLSANQEIKVNADKELLAQAFVNILNNAIKYSPYDSEIYITVTPTNKELVISITDQGCGIDSKYIENIFEPFYRVDKLRSKETGGTGLGLYITKCIIQKLNGSIECQSTVNKGTTFNIKMPL